MEEAELRELFAAIGRVSRVFIARDKVTNQPKGFAFVTYDLRETEQLTLLIGLLRVLRYPRFWYTT
ncbi:hypothetical protein ANCDUO_25351 [Ancylostoma duodenale]|uniref:RRM domain-containing protein n=1 Tax=Ancylostoma duodenale TaxID=51022 RepID=A0A0C2FD15_9BILA|nr:hypothetical protein ANCDUO_25351 [Ancylostoma duodenale]